MKTILKRGQLIVCLFLGSLLIGYSTNCSGTGIEVLSDDQRDSVIVNIPFADPFILLHDDVYYAYGTSSNAGFEVYFSSDLHEWKKHSEMLLKKEDSYGEKWFWAPEVYYRADENRFYLFYSVEEHICVATSPSPLGPFTQKEKKPMREEKGIDSSLFVDEDGTPYIYFVRFTGGNVIWVAELENDWMTIKEETLVKCLDVTQPWETSLGKVIEGPSVIKKDGSYYMLYSANDYRSQDYGVGYAIASNPLGPWKKSDENPILQNPKNGLVGTGHGAYFIDKEENYKYVFHAHASKSVVHPRFMNVISMFFTNDGIKMDETTIEQCKTKKTSKK